jgi:hypothetical protein
MVYRVFAQKKTVDSVHENKVKVADNENNHSNYFRSV